MSLQLSLPESLGTLVYQFSFWVPPTEWWEVDKRRGRVQRITEIFAQQRPRATNRGGHASMYAPEQNTVECANILHHFLQEVQRLGIEQHFPWVRGQVGLTCIGQAVPPKDYWEGKPHTKKPDASNMLKQLEDALLPNKDTGFVGAYLDDSWAVPILAYKQYGNIPGVQCTISLFENLLITKPVTPRKKKPNVD